MTRAQPGGRCKRGLAHVCPHVRDLVSSARIDRSIVGREFRCTRCGRSIEVYPKPDSSGRIVPMTDDVQVGATFHAGGVP